MKINKLKILVMINCLLLLLPLYAVKAFSQYYQGEELANELLLKSDDGLATVAIAKNSYQDNIAIYFNEENNPNLPDDLKLLSKVYQLNILTSKKSENSLRIGLSLTKDPQTAAAIFFWQNDNHWQKLNTSYDWQNEKLVAEGTGESLTFAAFEILKKSYQTTEKNIISSDQNLKIYLPKKWINSNSQITLKNYDRLAQLDNNLRVSDIYEYYIEADKILPTTELLTIKINYQTTANQAIDLYYWDEVRQQWQFWPAAKNTNSQYLLADWPFTQVKFALFKNTQAFEGTASWYKYKNCLCAASRDYPKGSKLKITNVSYDSKNFNKSIIVKINDYGPEAWTKNIIDLDKKAFQQLGNTKSGIINVRIEKIND